MPEQKLLSRQSACPTLFLLAFVACLPIASRGQAQVAKAKAPPNHQVLRSTSTGLYFVPNELIAQRRQLQQEIKALESIADEKSARQAQELQAALQKTYAELESSKVLVEPCNVSKQREILLYDLSPSEQIIINSDDVVVRGWNGDSIRCVLEKSVLAKEGVDAEAADEANAADLDAIQVAHEIRIAEDLVGVTDKQYAESEAKFEASAPAKEMNEQDRAFRNEIVQSIRSSKTIYKPLQGRSVNVLHLKGLTFAEGNQSLAAEFKSEGGGNRHTSFWRRSAKLTIYVPKCNTVVFRGCLKHVDIKSVNSDLILTTDGSHDIEYSGSFEIVDVEGDIKVSQVPIQKIAKVRGNVEVSRTTEYANVRTIHDQAGVRSESPPSKELLFQEIDGDIRGEFVRSNLVISGTPKGVIDIVNEYGDTDFRVSHALCDEAHRIVSQSGEIKIRATDHKQISQSIFAYTQVGSVVSQFDELKSRNFSVDYRNWYGFELDKNLAQRPMMFGSFSRPKKAWAGDERDNGIDLISNAGRVVLEVAARE
ncbi:MAG: hypothetical protein AAF483_13480 [Planctomycetota bacterium]